MVGRCWRPESPDDWETDAGKAFLSWVITGIFRDNARRRYPDAWFYMPCMAFWDIDATIVSDFSRCFPGDAAVLACLEGNPGRFHMVDSGQWALSR